MLQNVTIKSRLVFLIILLSLFMVVIGIGGLISLNAANTSLKTVHDDRLVPMSQLDHVIRLINRNQLTLARAIIGDPAQIGSRIDEIQRDREEADKAWAAFTATYLTPEEKILSEKFVAARQVLVQEALDPAIAALRAQNVKLATEIVEGKLDSRHKNVRILMDDLLKLQVDVAQKEFETAQSSYARFRVIALSLIVLGLLLGGGIGFWLVRGISRPLDYAVNIARGIANGDLTRKVEIASTDETGQLLQALKEMNDSLATIVSEVRSGTEAIGSASDQIASGNMDLSSRTEQQASSLEETASSMEELTSTVKQNADNARQANSLAMSASEVAMQGGQVVGQVVQTMGAINDSSKKIVDIIGVIDGIAFQTNILALNAAVEAARAGEQGRGFAVVAAEVRSLAQRSAGAAKEIKALIGDSVEKVDIGTKLVDQAGATMQEVVDSIRRVTDIMGEITAASQEQTSGIEQINMAITQMDDVTQQNAALVEEAAAAAQSMQQQAASLTRVVSVFKMRAGQHQQAQRSGGRTPTPGKSTALAAIPSPAPSATKHSAEANLPARREPTMPSKQMALAKGGGHSDDWEEF